jgi:hypothetical protein
MLLLELLLVLALAAFLSDKGWYQSNVVSWMQDLFRISFCEDEGSGMNLKCFHPEFRRLPAVQV